MPPSPHASLENTQKGKELQKYERITQSERITQTNRLHASYSFVEFKFSVSFSGFAP